MTRKLHLENLEPSDIEIKANTPSSGDQTIYKMYSIDGNENQCVITQTIIYANIPSSSDQTINERYAVTTSTSEDKLEFNKRWSLRASYIYKRISF